MNNTTTAPRGDLDLGLAFLEAPLTVDVNGRPMRVSALQDRRPLPGWRVTVNGHGVLRGMGVTLHAWPDGVWQARVNGPRPARVGADNLLSAQLAAEDAAREMVAQMAAVLGLKVVPA